MVAGLAGALYVPQVGIINPSEMATDKSLEAVVWVAVGGRGTLVGPIVGAIFVNALKSYATRAFPDYWLIILGGMFLFVVLFLPRGLVGLAEHAVALLKRVRKHRAPPIEAAPEPAASPAFRKMTAPIRPILAAEGVCKTFDGFKAISNLDFSMEEGELRTVIGPNGAGKTTFLDLITGRTKPDTGAIRFGAEGVDLIRKNEYEICRLGIGRKFQTPTVYTDHTVFENILLSLEGSRGVFAALFSRVTPAQRERIHEILRTIGLDAREEAKAGSLAHGQKQWLEIGMLLAQNARLLLVDEPAAGMTDEETARTGELLLSLAGRHSIIVIEHDMAFVRQIASKVTVLHQGSILCEGTVDEVQGNERVIEVYLGRKHQHN